MFKTVVDAIVEHREACDKEVRSDSWWIMIITAPSLNFVQQYAANIMFLPSLWKIGLLSSWCYILEMRLLCSYNQLVIINVFNKLLIHQWTLIHNFHIYIKPIMFTNVFNYWDAWSLNKSCLVWALNEFLNGLHLCLLIYYIIDVLILYLKLTWIGRKVKKIWKKHHLSGHTISKIYKIFRLNLFKLIHSFVWNVFLQVTNRCMDVIFLVCYSSSFLLFLLSFCPFW